MTAGRKIAVVAVSVLLTATLFGTTVATGVERTALNDEYVGERFEDEQVNSEIGSELRADIATAVDRSRDQQEFPTGISLDLNGEQVANQSVTDGFVSSELERNIERILRYLRGETDRLNLSTNLREIKRSVRTEIIDGVRIDAPQLVGANTDRIGAERVAQLASNEQSYRDAQLNLSTQERAEIDAEMQTNVRRQLSNESEPLARTILDHQRTVLDGLTGELSYEEYVDQLGADQRQIKAEIAALALREVPNQQSLFGEESDPKSALAPIRAGTGLVTIFTWLLPLLAVGLVGVGYVLTRSVDQTATVAGASLLVAGILGAILGFVAEPAVKSAVGVGGGSSDPIIAGLTGVVDGALGTIASQSLLLAVVGSLVLVTVGADRRGLLDGVRGRLSFDGRTERR